MSKLIAQLEEAVAALNAEGIEHVLIGGLAVAAHRVVRSTQGVDLLIDGDRTDEADATFRRLGYTAIHRTENVANYVRDPSDGLDVLYAPIANEGFPTGRPRPRGAGPGKTSSR